eukprot:gene15604-21709_t
MHGTQGLVPCPAGACRGMIDFGKVTMRRDVGDSGPVKRQQGILAQSPNMVNAKSIKAAVAILVAGCVALQVVQASAASRELKQWDGLSNPTKFPPYFCDTRPKGSPFYLRPSYTVVQDRVVCLDVKTREPEIESICNTMDFSSLSLRLTPSAHRESSLLPSMACSAPYPLLRPMGPKTAVL